MRSHLDKFTSYAGFNELEDAEEQAVIEELHNQYIHQYGEQLSHPATPRFREYLQMSMNTLQWRIEVDIPAKQKLASKLIVPAHVECVVGANYQDYDRALDVCKWTLSVIQKYVAQKREILLVN